MNWYERTSASERERSVARAVQSGAKQADIAKHLGLSRPRIHQLYRKGLSRQKHQDRTSNDFKFGWLSELRMEKAIWLRWTLQLVRFTICDQSPK